MASSTPDAILRLPEVEKLSGWSKATIYRHMATGAFPQAIRLGVRNTGWLESEMQQWIAERANSRTTPATGVGATMGATLQRCHS